MRLILAGVKIFSSAFVNYGNLLSGSSLLLLIDEIYFSIFYIYSLYSSFIEEFNSNSRDD